MSFFDPNAAASPDSGIFGLPFTETDAKLILIPVPWEATTSYGSGTASGPESIFEASKQVDLFDYELGNFFMLGIAMLSAAPEILEWNALGRVAAEPIITAGGAGEDLALQTLLTQVNGYSVKVNESVYYHTRRCLEQGKIVGIVGGDHSTPFGAIQAYLERYPNMGILHIDAHADLRCAYEGFVYSHASIMYNVVTQTTLPKLVQVGIRDFCEAEFELIQANKGRITTFFDADLAARRFSGESWMQICDQIVAQLPQEVYVSFDIDGLNPVFCPHTGTPVPGGLEFNEAVFLLRRVIDSGRKIIGFDLTEVAPAKTESLSEHDTSAEWDANVGARLLYKLCGWALASR